MIDVYFAISISGKRDNLNVGKKIVKVLKKINFNVLSEHIIRDDAWEYDSQVSMQHVLERDMRWIDRSSCLIAQVSSPSLGVGYEIAYALNLKKPVLCIIKKEAENRLSKIIRGNTSSYIRVVSYKNIKEIETIIRLFIKEFSLGE